MGHFIVGGHEGEAQVTDVRSGGERNWLKKLPEEGMKEDVGRELRIEQTAREEWWSV